MNKEIICKSIIWIIIVFVTIALIGFSFIFRISYFFPFVFLIFSILLIVIIECYVRIQHNIERKGRGLNEIKKMLLNQECELKDLKQKIPETYDKIIMLDNKLNEMDRKISEIKTELNNNSDIFLRIDRKMYENNLKNDAIINKISEFFKNKARKR